MASTKAVWGMLLLSLVAVALLWLLTFFRSSTKREPAHGGEFPRRTPASGRAEVVLTLTTTPERLANSWMERALDNLLDMDGVHAVYLNVPFVYKKTAEAYTIPSFVSSLEASTHLRVHRCEDEGPATKVLATLRNPEVSDDAFVVVVDDDVMYYPDVVISLLEAAGARTRSDAADAGASPSRPGVVYLMCSSQLAGYQAYAATKGTMRCLLDYQLPKDCFTIDDDWIHMIFSLEHITYETVPHRGDSSWVCSFDPRKTDTHPRWFEMNNEDGPRRRELQERCKAALTASAR